MVQILNKAQHPLEIHLLSKDQHTLEVHFLSKDQYTLEVQFLFQNQHSLKVQLLPKDQHSHKAFSANPLGFVRTECFESSALLLAGDGAAEDYIVVGRRIRRPRPYIILYIYPQDNQSPTSVIIGSAVVRNQGRPLKTNRASST